MNLQANKTSHIEQDHPGAGWNRCLYFLGTSVVLATALISTAFIAMALISLPPTNITAIWLPSGIALVAMAWWMGWSALPIILLSNVAVVYLANGYPITEFRPFTWLLALVNTASPALSYIIWCIWLKRRNPYADGIDYLKFVFGVALVPNLLSAWLVIAIIFWAGFLQNMTMSEFAIRSAVNTISSALAIILIVPLATKSALDKCERIGRSVIRFGLFIGIALLVGWSTIHLNPLTIVCAIPLALFAALNGGPKVVAATVLTLSFYGLILTKQGYGPFNAAGAVNYDPVLAMAIFAFALSIPGQYAGIAQQQLKAQRKRLADDVKQRTAELASAEEQLRLAFEASTDGIFDWSASTETLRYNHAFSVMLGMDPSEHELASRQVLNHIHPEDRSNAEISIQRAISGNSDFLNFEIRSAAQSEKTVWLKVRGKTVEKDPNGYALRIVGTTTDITKEKSRQLELEQAKEQAQKAERAKGDFIATLGHEIRTPLNGVIGYSSLLDQENLNKQQHEYTAAIQTSAKSLLTLLNDLLDLSKLDAGAMRMETSSVELRKTLNQVALIFRPEASRKEVSIQIELAPDLPDSILGDETRIQQILNNLLSNAVKFTERGAIQIKAELKYDKDRPMVAISVTDTGIGIKAENIQNLFIDYQQEHLSTSRKYGGTGLGLSISRKLCELMGGDLHVHSIYGQGSTFTARFEYLQKQEPESGPSPKETVFSADLNTEKLTDIRILVAEDHRVNQRMLGIYFDRNGITHTIVNNGAEALDAVQSGEYDLILMDLHMPIMDGATATRKIRAFVASNQRKPIRIVAVSATSDVSLREYSDAGFDGTLQKPINFETLKQEILKTPRRC